MAIGVGGTLSWDVGQHYLPAPGLYTIVVLAGADTALEKPTRERTLVWFVWHGRFITNNAK